MKTKLLLTLTALLALTNVARSQETAFTYQGRLNNTAGPVSGIYDLQFALFDTPAVGSPVAGPLTNSPIAVSNGLFTVTLDFGAGVFTGAERWLDMSVFTTALAQVPPPPLVSNLPQPSAPVPIGA
jgi:hypothetical protein